MAALIARRRRRRGRGQALVEFALVFPLLMLLVFALIDLGRVVYTHNAIAEAAREGARWGSVQARSARDIPGIEAHAVGNVVGRGGRRHRPRRPASVQGPSSCHARRTTPSRWRSRPAWS